MRDDDCALTVIIFGEPSRPSLYRQSKADEMWS